MKRKRRRARGSQAIGFTAEEEAFFQAGEAAAQSASELEPIYERQPSWFVRWFSR